MNKFFSHAIAVFGLLALCTPLAHSQWRPRNPVTNVQRQADGVLFTQKTGFLKVQVCADSIVHIVYSPTASYQPHRNYVVIKDSWNPVAWTMDETNDAVTISTAMLKVSIARLDGSIIYRDQTGAW